MRFEVSFTLTDERDNSSPATVSLEADTQEIAISEATKTVVKESNPVYLEVKSVKARCEPSRLSYPASSRDVRW